MTSIIPTNLNVTGIQVSGSDNKVRGNVSANLPILFPSVVPKVVVSEVGVGNRAADTMPGFVPPLAGGSSY